MPLVLCRLIFKWKLKAGKERAYTVCVCVFASRLICATSAQPAQGSSPLEKWVTFPDDVKSPSASPVCGALPKPPHAIPRPYNGNVFSEALMNHLPNLSQFLNLNTGVSLTMAARHKVKIVSDKGVFFFHHKHELCAVVSMLVARESETAFLVSEPSHCDQGSEAAKLPRA